MIFIDGKRNGYSPNQCGETTTVKELRDYLNELIEWYGMGDDEIYLTNDGGYTFGSIPIDEIMVCENTEDYIQKYSRYAD